MGKQVIRRECELTRKQIKLAAWLIFTALHEGFIQNLTLYPQLASHLIRRLNETDVTVKIVVSLNQ